MPTLSTWLLQNPYGEGTRVVAERNPYYFKVDSQGNQLPYIDRVVFDQFEDSDVLLLRALNGGIDMMSRHFNTLSTARYSSTMPSEATTASSTSNPTT